MSPRSHPTFRFRCAVAVVALGLAAGLAACGSDGSEPAASDQTTTSAADVDSSPEGDLPPEIEMADAQVLIGLTEVDARAKADDAGWALRVVRVDGRDGPATNDYNPERVNVSIANGKIDQIIGIG